MTLAERVKRAVKFDEDECRPRMRPANMTTDVEDMVVGALQDRKHLKPLIEALVECAQAGQEHLDAKDENADMAATFRIQWSLAELRAALERMEKR